MDRDLKELARQLRKEGKSLRRIAKRTGVSHETVRKELEGVEKGVVERKSEIRIEYISPITEELARNFGERCQELRRKRGWTQGEIGERMMGKGGSEGARGVAVSRWERGEVVPSGVYLRRFLEIESQRKKHKGREV